MISAFLLVIEKTMFHAITPVGNSVKIFLVSCQEIV